MSHLTNAPISLTPRWCEQKDILRGWVILHSDVTAPIGLQHLRYIKLHCVSTNKTTYCRIFGPGQSKAYNEIEQSKVKSSIFMDAHYQQSLGISEDRMGKTKHDFVIRKVWPSTYYLTAVCHHPDDSVRVGAFLGVTSLTLGIVSLLLGILSVYT